MLDNLQHKSAQRRQAILLYQKRWSPQASGTTGVLVSVWGSSASDVFAIGSGPTILHYNGTAWSPQIPGTTNLLRAVWGSSESDVFAVGWYGTILNYSP